MKAAIFSLIILFLSTSVLMGQKKQELSKNPFKDAGYDVLMATSSKGEFVEFHDQTDIVEIGSVLYDTKTKQIIKILDKEDSTTVISSVTPAMSIDPLCEKYYWISPYAYCMNNPMRYKDPDGRDGMVTGSGTKEDPYIITATYIYQNGTLNESQQKGLNSAIDSYNKSGGKDGVKIKNADGSTSYVKYNLSANGVDDTRNSRMATAFETTSGETMYYGNIVGTEPNVGNGGDEYGSAHNFEIHFNTDNLREGVASGMNSSSLHKGVAIHEIGHNLGGEHSHGTSVMDAVTTHPHQALNGTITYTYTYPSMSNNFTKIIFGNKNTPRTEGSGRLWTKKP